MISGEELNKILRTIEICAINYNKNEDGMEMFEWGELWILDEYINNLHLKSEKLQKKIVKIMNYLESQEEVLQRNVQYFEKKLKNTDKKSFYYNSYLKRIHAINSKRELIKEILGEWNK